MRRAAFLAILVTCFALACGDTREPRESASTRTIALRDVVQAEIARLERPARVIAPLTEDTLEQLRGSIATAAHGQGKVRALALEDGKALGAGAIAELSKVIDDVQRDERERLAALEILGGIDVPEAAEALARRIDLQIVREPWVRAQAAFQLTRQSSDHWLPRVLAQLKYETDGPTVIWIAAALAHHANYAGVEGLHVLSTSARDDQVRADAIGTFERLATEAGFTSTRELYDAWFGDDAARKLPRKEPSPALRLEMWRCIARLHEFDLRLVDDARFALSRSAHWIVEPLTAALADTDEYVRLHSAQCLERMGPRARSACPALVQALDDARTAPSIARALGEIGCEAARSALVARTAREESLELRTAAAAALGGSGFAALAHANAAGEAERAASAPALAALRRLLDPSEPLDLRQIAAQALLAHEDDGAAVELLSTCLTSPSADGGAAENALQGWLERRSSAGDARCTAALERWRSTPSASLESPTLEQRRARLRERASIAAELVSALRSASTAGG